jgi:hypothetical protein
MIVEPCGAAPGPGSIKGHPVGCGHDHGHDAAADCTAESDGESIHWYCAQSQGTCLGGGVACPFAPYALPGTVPTSFPNPNTKSPIYAGPRARYWPNTTVEFYINCPQGEANIDARPASLGGALQEDVFPSSTFGTSNGSYQFPLCPGEYYYRYSEFIDDVCLTMAKYGAIADTATHPALPPAGYTIAGGTLPLASHRCRPSPMPPTIGSPYTTIKPVFGGISGPEFPPYPAGSTPPAPNIVDKITRFYGPDPFAPPISASFNCLYDNPFTLLATKQIWEVGDPGGTFGSSCLGVGGPTGDEVNEFIWIDDVSGNNNFLGLTSCLVNVATGEIQECDVLFFKRSSNPSPWPRYNCAVPTATSGCANGVGPGATTIYGHEIGHFFGLDHTNLHPGLGINGLFSIAANPTLNVFPIPNGAPPSFATYAVTTIVNGVSVVTSVPWSAMPDMVASPTVTNEWRCSPLRPLHPDEQAAIAELYGVAAVSSVTSSSLVTFETRPVINDFARWEGTTYVSTAFTPTIGDEEDGALFLVPAFGINVFPLLAGANPQTYPDVGKVSGTATLSANDTVGRRDTQTGAPTSARFRMDGIVVGAGGSDVSLCAEPLQSLFNFAPGATTAPPFSEWWQFAGYGNPVLNRVWNVGVDLSVQRQLNSRFAHPGASLGTLFSFPGTVLEVDIDLPQAGFPLLVSAESVTRPAISILPRDASLLLPGATLTATVYHDYELDRSTARWEITGGGTISGSATMSASTQPTPPLASGATGPWITTYTLAVSAPINGVGSDTVRFVCVELPTANNLTTYRPPIGVTPVRGINEVRF